MDRQRPTLKPKRQPLLNPGAKAEARRDPHPQWNKHGHTTPAVMQNAYRHLNTAPAPTSAAPEHGKTQRSSMQAAPEHLNTAPASPSAAREHGKTQRSSMQAAPEHFNIACPSMQAAREHLNTAPASPSAAREQTFPFCPAQIQPKTSQKIFFRPLGMRF